MRLKLIGSRSDVFLNIYNRFTEPRNCGWIVRNALCLDYEELRSHAVIIYAVIASAIDVYATPQNWRPGLWFNNLVHVFVGGFVTFCT